MAKFHSIYAGLTLQDEDGVWAQFVDGVHETDDDGVADRLRNAPGIAEVDAEPATVADAEPTTEPTEPATS